MQGISQSITKLTGIKMPNYKTMQSCVCVKARQHDYICGLQVLLLLLVSRLKSANFSVAL